jgi:hypothetical protein
MTWTYRLHVRCLLLPAYHDFIDRQLFHLFSGANCYHRAYREYEKEEVRKERLEEQDRVYQTLSKSHKDLIDLWKGLRIGDHFVKYEREGNLFSCQILKRMQCHPGTLHEDYELFVKDILVPITSEILECRIVSDDDEEGSEEQMQNAWVFTDLELRGGCFILKDYIKEIEHTYNEDRTEILETRVVYKRSIPQRLFLDLDGAYVRR